MIVVSDSGYLHSTLFPILTPVLRSYEERMHERNKEEIRINGRNGFYGVSSPFHWLCLEQNVFSLFRFCGNKVVRFFGGREGVARER